MSDPLTLDSPLTALPGVGPKRAAALERLGIQTVRDALRHLPRGYEDRGKPVSIASASARDPGDFAVVRGRVDRAHLRRTGRGRTTFRVVLADETASIVALWFNAPFLASEIAVGSHVALSGRLSEGRAFLQPEVARLAEEDPIPDRLTGIRASYALTEGVSARLLRACIGHALAVAHEIEDPWPPEVLAIAGMPPLREAVVAAHRPRFLSEAEAACDRLRFDELLPVELAMRRRLRERRARTAPLARASGGGAARFVRSLPFALSESQAHSVDEIVADMRGDRPMTRLLAGEVGSGKTVVAFAALEEARSRGHAAALLAPTDLLARQHARTALQLLPKSQHEVVLLVGSLNHAEARRARERLATGEASIAIGTHALLSDSTRIPRLGLVVVDEQHRFGVEQREALLARADTPHSLLLTATPIPRSLALLAYGDADVSTLERLRGARGRVVTEVIPGRARRATLRRIRELIDAGEQAFFVRPRIDGDDAGVEELHRELERGPLAGVRTEIVHGRLPADERDARLGRFAAGEVAALVATTVIEVGIDVPGATILWVEGAERLGLAQLHQLRGRIARRGQTGYCWIVEGADAPDSSRERLRTFAKLDDGLILAELDLALRGPGELLGLRQSGRFGMFAGLGAGAPARWLELSERAWRAADFLLGKEPDACAESVSSASASR